MNTCFCLSVVLVSLCSYVSEISTTSREHSCYSDHIQRCVLGGGGLHMSNISFGQEAEKQRIYASVGCSQAQAVDWKGSSEEPGFVCLPKCCGNLAMCFWLRNVLIKIFVLLFILCLILRIIFLLQLDISLCDLLQTNYSTLAIFHGFSLVP